MCAAAGVAPPADRAARRRSARNQPGVARPSARRPPPDQRAHPEQGADDGHALVVQGGLTCQRQGSLVQRQRAD
jgi:hypothetical protein